MTPYPKRLIEVDLPIKKISEHARREKSIRHGHISTLHIWWARKPIAVCRAVMCAALWVDPADPLCPEKFRRDAAALMKRFFDPMGTDGKDFNDPPVLRGALLDFIADFANWDNSTKKEYLETSRALTQSAHESLGGAPGTKPLVVDPFAGGGSIPLEALRVGADAFASDLNPVAVLLNKVVIEFIPKYGQRLADEIRKWGEWVKQKAEEELAEYYPKDSKYEIPIAYIWFRVVICEGPGCGAKVPLTTKLWLAKKGNHSVALKLIPKPKEKRVDFEIIPNAKPIDVGNGTVRRGSATCPCCGYTTPVTSVRKQLKARGGGAADAQLAAVVTTHLGCQGRVYRLPSKRDLEAVNMAAEKLAKSYKEHIGSLSLVPDEVLPVMSGVFNAPIYGHNTWGSLFTPRQALALTTLVRLTKKTGEMLASEHEKGLALAVQTCLALALDRQADYTSSLSSWWPGGQKIQHTFARQALPMIWDFAEGNPFSGSTGCWEGAYEWGFELCQHGSIALDHCGHIECVPATTHPLPDDAAQCLFTDPPYYNAIPYADLSDFFYVWLRRTIGEQYPDLFREILSPKDGDICEMAGWDPERYAHKDGKWFEERMTQAMAEGRRVLAPNGIGIVVFAHKSTSGWEAQLQAMINAGWIITGSWPIDTEMGTRLRAMNSAALASSIHLVCRPRPPGSESAIGDWRDVLQELPVRIHEWMPRLAQEGVVGADAIFACLGPALEIFSRYSRVEKASGEQVKLKVYLEHVWAAVAKEALAMIFQGADATGFEEDARLTAMWLWTLSTGANGNGNQMAMDESDDEDEASGKSPRMSGFVLEYDAARKIAQGLGAHLEQLSKLVEIKGDKARLLPVEERTAYLFGKEDIQTPRRKKKEARQLTLTGVLGEAEEEAGGWGEMKAPPPGTTVLDRVHQAMILFAAGRSDALKRFLVEDGIGRDERFWRLAQAFSALYPAGTDEKRWVEGLMARKKGLGF